MGNTLLPPAPVGQRHMAMSEAGQKKAEDATMATPAGLSFMLHVCSLTLRLEMGFVVLYGKPIHCCMPAESDPCARLVLVLWQALRCRSPKPRPPWTKRHRQRTRPVP